MAAQIVPMAHVPALVAIGRRIDDVEAFALEDDAAADRSCRLEMIGRHVLPSRPEAERLVKVLHLKVERELNVVDAPAHGAVIAIAMRAVGTQSVGASIIGLEWVEAVPLIDPIGCSDHAPDSRMAAIPVRLMSESQRAIHAR